MMPVPTHLVGIAVPAEAEVDEAPLRAELRCGCGSLSFEFLYPGQTQVIGGREIPCDAEIDGNYFYIVSARCTACRAERVLLDADFHGWNGLTCHDPVQAAAARPPLTPWHCRNCRETAHVGMLFISGEGKDDFIEEAGSDFDPDRWPDAFGWFSLSCSCLQCGLDEPDRFVSETM